MKIKVGLGVDVHQLKEGEQLWLGGILIPSEKGAVGHSDADVLIHAIIDALLGAANLRDIGYQFPDSDKAYKNIDSKKLLVKTYELIKAANYRINNIDATLILQSPKIMAYIEHMKEILSEILHLDVSDISIKATTSEKLGFEGREEGVKAYAVTLLIRK